MEKAFAPQSYGAAPRNSFSFLTCGSNEPRDIWRYITDTFSVHTAVSELNWIGFSLRGDRSTIRPSTSPIRNQSHINDDVEKAPFS